jgi:hypothetical protein
MSIGGGSQGGGSFSQAHHGLVMSKVPSKLSGVQISQGNSGGAAAVPLPSSIQMQGNKRNLIQGAQNVPNYQNIQSSGGSQGGHSQQYAH